MPVQALVSISFQAADSAEVQSAVDALSLPDGAQVSASVTETVVAGTVQAGQVMPPDLPGPPPDPAQPAEEAPPA